MKVKHSKAIRAYMAIANMSNDKIPLSISYKLFKVKKMLQPQWDFQNERTNAIIKKYKPTQLFNGGLKFKSKAEGEKFAKEVNDMIAEIGEMDIDFAEIKKPVISLDTNINMSVDDIDALSDFIEFKE